jgi:tyrosine phenol-lyase
MIMRNLTIDSTEGNDSRREVIKLRKRGEIMTISEPYKIKEVKHLPRLASHQRLNVLQNAGFNVLNVPSDSVTFDLVARGMSAWSHFQKAGFMIGDEAYAGSRNFLRLQEAADKVLGIGRLVPTHNGIGAEKLITTTLVEKDQVVLHNRSRTEGLVPFLLAKSVDVTGEKAGKYQSPEKFGADLDLKKLQALLEATDQRIALIHVVLCPDAWCGQPVSMENLEAVKKLGDTHKIPVVIDISNVLENAWWINKASGEQDLMATVRKIVALADVVMMDAAQDCRSDVGGFVSSDVDEIFEKLRNQVVVFEGLHTYGGMTGRAMEVFCLGLEEMQNSAYTQWYDHQVELLYSLLSEKGLPVYRGTKAVGLDVAGFFPSMKEDDFPKFVLAACLFVAGGIRARIIGGSDYHIKGEGEKVLTLELPRLAYTCDQIEAIADTVVSVYENRDKIYPLALVNQGVEFVDELVFEPQNHRLFVSFPEVDRIYEPHKIAIFEPIKVLDKNQRKAAIKGAGYNTFLLNSEDISIDLLTDSGTTAMSCYQWEGMSNSTDTAYSSRHYDDLVEDFSEILGYKHIIPTHQGRAAEHIMSQVMIKQGQSVPGNMYFTTTKLHQEMAGGVFVDVIVDQAHDPKSQLPWKGNIDLDKLQKEIDRVGAKGIAYVSYEMSVNMAGGQPFSMQNAKEVSALCQKHGIPLMYDATRCVENARMIKIKDPDYANKSVEEILREMMSYGDGCTVSCKKDFMVNMGGLLACNNDELAHEFKRMLRIWEGDLTTGGLDPKDIEALRRGLLDSLDDDYIAARVEQTQLLGKKLIEAGIPIVEPPGSHAIFLDAKKFLPHVDQNDYPSQALAAAIYIETGVRAMERGNVSKGRNPQTGENYCPALELVRLTIPRRVYSNSHFSFVVDGLKRLWEQREKISGLRFTYEPKVLRFFQGRFEPKTTWDF